jgi:cytochrome c oxidase assembly protein subunit 11
MTKRYIHNEKSQQGAKRTLMALCLVVMGMSGLAYASVPLYNLFCRVTGYGGTTQQTAVNDTEVIDREIKIHFDASLARGMPWSFKPQQKEIILKVGESGIAFYEAYNPTDKPITGTATYNVTPQKVGEYFVKIDCFCFTEQTLMPGQRVDMPVTFYVDPELDQDEDAKEVKTITLSYTFFQLKTDKDGEETTKDKVANLTKSKLDNLKD